MNNTAKKSTEEFNQNSSTTNKVSMKWPTSAGDDRWRLLESLRSHGGLEVATSISVLCDDRGIVRWVHTGPRLHPSSDPEHGFAEASFRELERLLAESLR